MALTGTVKISLNNGDTKECFTSKEAYVTLNSFLIKAQKDRTSNIRIGGEDVIPTKDIYEIEWIEEEWCNG